MGKTLQELRQELAHLDTLFERTFELRQQAWEVNDPNQADINDALDIGYKALELKRAKVLERIQEIESHE